MLECVRVTPSQNAKVMVHALRYSDETPEKPHFNERITL